MTLVKQLKKVEKEVLLDNYSVQWRSTSLKAGRWLHSYRPFISMFHRVATVNCEIFRIKPSLQESYIEG